MGQCVCKERRARGARSGGGRSGTSRRSAAGGGDRRDDGAGGDGDHYRHAANVATTSAYGGGSNGRTVPDAAAVALALAQHQRLSDIGLDVRHLILETLTVIRTLINNEQEPPSAMLKLNLIADKEQGWLLIVQQMIETIPADNPLGPAVITLFLDESPLPTRETVVKLLFHLSLSAKLSRSSEKLPIWHRNVCIVLGCIAEKLAGVNSVAIFRPDTLDYLLANLSTEGDPNVILFSLIALEKYAQTSENRSSISNALTALSPNPLEVLEGWLASTDSLKRQVGFCAQWCLDNLFVKEARPFSYEVVDTEGMNAMLNHEDVSEYLKIAPNGLEARCDVSSFESVRCTFQSTEGVWYYEALIVTPGVMQIGWATKDSKFFNHEGYGIGDDEYSVAYDGCRQLVWHSATSVPSSHSSWKAGDVLGCLLDMDKREVQFALNGVKLDEPHTKLFQSARTGFFAAASFMSFQQCCFNFGLTPFKFPPKEVSFRSFNDCGSLSEEQRIILPRRRRLELLRQISVPEDSCQLCYNHSATVRLMPCNHNGFCSDCAQLLESCPFCRAAIVERRESVLVAAVASLAVNGDDGVTAAASSSMTVEELGTTE